MCVYWLLQLFTTDDDDGDNARAINCHRTTGANKQYDKYNKIIDYHVRNDYKRDD